MSPELDPEKVDGQIEDESSSSVAEGDEYLVEARGHYVDVGYEALIVPTIHLLTMTSKSKLRKSDGVDLGPQYKGSSISRDALLEEESENDPFGSHSEQDESGSSQYADPDEQELQGQDDEEIDSDEAFENGDEDRFGGHRFRGSKTTGQDMEDSEGSEAEDLVDEDGDKGMEFAGDYLNGSESGPEPPQDDDSDMEVDNDEEPADSDSDDTSVSDEPYKPEADDRAALRKMMAEEQKTVAASLSKAAKADVAKGGAIKHQRTTFDALLNTRIKLQKALISTNSMSTSTPTSSDHTETIRAAESAALNLWNTISTLRSSLHVHSPKKSLVSVTSATPSSTLWKEMQSHETVSLPARRANLTKWSQKTNPITALPRTNKFSQIPTQQPLTSVLDQHLSGSNLEKLLDKTRIPRSCAPVQAATRTPSDPTIYDDADFYTLLLRELVDQRMADSSAPAAASNNAPIPALPSQRDFKVKKQVDTKASKGRKMRYTVHEKLQNFMAPEDRGSWGERQRGELFSSLLGRKMQLAEEEVEVGDARSGSEVDGEMDGIEGGEGGLRLFG